MRSIAKLAMVLFLATSCQSEESSEVLGQMSSGGRRGALGMKIQLASFGNGADRSALDAIDTYLLSIQDTIINRQQRNWGREGEINLCIDFNSYETAYQASFAIGRIIWLSRDRGYASSFDLIERCGDDSLETFTGQQRGPFQQEPGTGVSLRCESLNGSTRVEVKEILDAQGENIQVLVDFGSGQFQAASKRWVIQNGLHIEYSLDQSKLTFTPALSLGSSPASLSLHGHQIELTCQEAR